MAYIAEIIDEHEVWLLTEHRCLVSIHESLEDARNRCANYHNVAMRVIDRRKDMAGWANSGQRGLAG